MTPGNHLVGNRNGGRVGIIDLGTSTHGVFLAAATALNFIGAPTLIGDTEFNGWCECHGLTIDLIGGQVKDNPHPDIRPAFISRSGRTKSATTLGRQAVKATSPD